MLFRSGKAVVGEVGELVLTGPIPSMPVSFWNDADGSRLRAAYFEAFDGVWRHGDWLKVNERGGCVIYGRSDSTLNRGGVRMDGLGIRMIVALYLALGSGEMKLQSADPNEQPYLDYNYLQESFDRQRMREGVLKGLELTKHPDFQAIIESRTEPLDSDLASDDALDDWLMREATTGQHISGTCKMGPASDPMAVVDQRGKVHGIDALRVADASIMPDCVRANTNVTAIMIGERVADFIKQG